MNITPATGAFRMVVPFTKHEKMPDGRLMVEGIATSEALDHANEIVDYESAKAAFAAWPGNIREQHDPKKAVGRALEVIADDATKSIRVKAFVSAGAPDTQAKVLDGTLTCYSIGGSVKERVATKATKADGAEVEATRLIVSKLTETSLVDAGCNPETAIQIVKSDGDEGLVGVDLAEEVKADEAEPIALEVSGSDAEVAEFAKALNESNLTMADAIAAVRAAAAQKAAAGATEGTEASTLAAPEIVEPVAATPAAEGVAKGIYNVQAFAECLQCLASIAGESEAEADWEGDDSPVPAQLREWLAGGVALFQSMAAEESDELLANLRAAAGESEPDMIAAAIEFGDLRKRVTDPELPFPDLYALAVEHLGDEAIKAMKAANVEALREAIVVKAGARHSRVDAAHLQEAHDHLVGMGAKCAKEAAAAVDDLIKAAAPADELAKTVATLRTEVDHLKRQPVLARTAALSTLKAVTKQEDNTSDAAPLTDAQLIEKFAVRDAKGEVDLAATAIQLAHRMGGTPLRAVA